VWDKASYPAQMLYCQRTIESGSSNNLQKQLSLLNFIVDEMTFLKALERA
jgi:hypothetical protein